MPRILYFYLLALLLTGCSDGTLTHGVPPGDVVLDVLSEVSTVDPTPWEDLESEGPWAVATTTWEFVDDTRPTPAHGQWPMASSRSLTTEIWYPAINEGLDEEMAIADAPFPLVLHAHGFMSTRLDSPGLARLLASHGFVVVCPDFPLSNRNAPGGPTIIDAASQPGDLFAIHRALRTGEDLPVAVVAERIDVERALYTGVSLGGFTGLMAAYEPAPDLSAPLGVVALAPATCFLPERVLENPVPLLVMHGDKDAILPISTNADTLYEKAPAPKIMATLTGGTHTGFADVSDALLADLDHADVVGCIALEDALPETPEDAWFDAIGGIDQRFVGSACDVPCEDPTILSQGMSTLRQSQISLIAVHAFARSQLLDDPHAEAFLTQQLNQAEDVHVQWAPAPLD